jgi:hypothetical protein
VLKKKMREKTGPGEKYAYFSPSCIFPGPFFNVGEKQRSRGLFVKEPFII